MRHATRWGRAGALAIVAAIGVASAGAVSATTEPGGTGEPEVSSETLVIGRTGDVDKLDPHLATAFQTIDALELIYEPLTTLAPDSTVGPGLATDWSYNEDGTELTFHLREGVTFHDGSEMTSEDVVASIERILDEETGAAGRGFLLSIEDVTAPDDYTVVLSLSTADAALPAALSRVITAIMSSDDIAAGTVGTQPNGTGPFSFGEWTQGQQLDLAANENYWGDGPYVAGISIRVVPDEQSTLAALQAGEVHLGVITDPAVVEQVSEPLVLEQTEALGYFPFFLNSSRGPLQERAVRQAISCAIDRQELIDTALLGQGRADRTVRRGHLRHRPVRRAALQRRARQGCRPPIARRRRLPRRVLDRDDHHHRRERDEHQPRPEPAVPARRDRRRPRARAARDQRLRRSLARCRLRLGAVGEQLRTRPAPDVLALLHHRRQLRQRRRAADARAGRAVRPRVGGDRSRGAACRSTPKISRILLEESPWVWLYRGYRYQVHVPELEGFVPTPSGSLFSLSTATLTSG